jgi:hypothetical protein
VSRTRYLVARIEFEVHEYGYHVPEDDPVVPVELFAQRAAAEDAARRLERAARRTLTPFRIGDELGLLTRRDEGELLAALRSVGLPPLPDYSAAWPGWWEEHVAPLSDDAQNLAWDLFERVKFYRVVEVKVEE